MTIFPKSYKSIKITGIPNIMTIIITITHIIKTEIKIQGIISILSKKKMLIINIKNKMNFLNNHRKV